MFFFTKRIIRHCRNIVIPEFKTWLDVQKLWYLVVALCWYMCMV